VSKFTRREFLGASAATVGVAALHRLPSALLAARAVTPGGGSLFSVKHVVILMQENRSFDHYFGTLRGVRGFDDPVALQLRDGGSVFNQPRSPDSSSSVAPFHLNGGSNAPCIADLDHSWAGTHEAWNRAAYDRWVTAKGEATMGYLKRSDIPFHHALADSFTICDSYFCSVMGPTKPNRLYLWSGTIDSAGTAGGPVIDNSKSGFGWTTYPERLQSAGVSWKVYQNANDNYDDNALAWFRQYQDARPGTPLHDRGMASVPAISGETSSDIVSAIEKDVLDGTLPQVSWIVAPEECSEHPSYPPENGADFIARVLGALAAEPDVWASTVFLINYDENDGFFDHVPPPVPAPGTPDEFVDNLPIGLGPRVPMFVISPWSRGGHVCSEVFDHTSVIRFLEILTGVVEPNISQWRRALCGDLTSAFDFTTVVLSVPELPAASPIAGQAMRECPSSSALVPGVHAVSVPDNRPARALPYRPNAGCRVDVDNRTLRIEMINAGARAVNHAIYTSEDDVARFYDVPAQAGSVEDCFAVPAHGKYDLSVYGPGAFLRRMAGNIDGVGGRLEVSCAYKCRAPGPAKLLFTMTNRSSETVHLTITANAYRNDGPWTHSLEPGQTAHDAFELQQSGGSYDFTVTTRADAAFLRRFAGRLEAGLSQKLHYPVIHFASRTA
jgi:phospholipase C